MCADSIAYSPEFNPPGASAKVAWEILLAAKQLLVNSPYTSDIGLSFDSDEQAVVRSKATSPGEQPLIYTTDGKWLIGGDLDDETTAFFSLYLPILGTRKASRCVVAHLGQSVDSQIATHSGDSFYVTGEENRIHLHRLRALCDAVLVGIETASIDDPQLTTRAVRGPNPIRVIIDPKGRAENSLGLLSDNAATTWIIRGTDDSVMTEDYRSGVYHLYIPEVDGHIPGVDIISALQRKGINKLFIEGGGFTVSSMIASGCIDRLHITSAPIFVGNGRPAINLPGVDSMQNAIRPGFRIYRMGEDIMWDFDLRDQDSAGKSVGKSPGQNNSLVQIF